jgi:hypothetical protein
VDERSLIGLSHGDARQRGCYKRFHDKEQPLIFMCKSKIEIMWPNSYAKMHNGSCGALGSAHGLRVLFYFSSLYL